MNALLPAFEFTHGITSNALGAVYFANQRSLDRQVAVKVFSPELGNDPGFRGSLEIASRAMAGLSHPNLIGLLDSGRAGDMPYWVMEFVPGKSLARSTRGQMLEFGQAMALLDGICAGLCHAHDKGLVHGHLNTLSILLNQQTAPKIGNFGLASPVHTDPAAVVPTHCTAPEVPAKSGSATIRSDVFSLGAIFYELITGTPHGPEATPASRLCGCRPEIDAVLRQATDPDPSRRMADVRAFQTALKEAAEPSLNTAAAPMATVPIATAVSPRPSAGRVAKVAPMPKGGFDTRLLVKIAIIIGLLIAINFTWHALKNTRANREKENREVLARAEARKEEAKALAEGAWAREMAETAARKTPETVIPKYVPQAERPEDSLDRLKSSLASGSRSQMPVGSIRKGESDYFLVSEPMAWAEAAWFAEQHGAHLATPDTDLSWLSDEVTKGRTCWLGAAKSGGESWILVDGTVWTAGTQPSGNGSFLAVGQGGELSAADGGSELPFVIQWHGGGRNPGMLAAALAATGTSLKSGSPVFPPGTVAHGARHYLHVPRPVTWEEAAALAESGGGHLLAVSDTDELAKLEEMTKRLKAPDGIWLGGSLEQDHWRWATGEPWQAAKWTSNAAAAEEGSALILLPGRGWDGRDRANAASGFIIEWSADAEAAKTAEPVASAGDAAAELNAKVKELVLAADRKRKDELASNVKKFRWDLDSLLRTLAKSDQNAWGPHFAALKECVKDDYVQPDRIKPRRITVSPDMAKLVAYHTKKQGEIDAQFSQGAQKIRDAYVAKMTEIRAAAEASGQIKVAADAKETIGDAADLGSWIRSFGVD